MNDGIVWKEKMKKRKLWPAPAALLIRHVKQWKLQVIAARKHKRASTA